jgi:hypothetical protein
MGFQYVGLRPTLYDLALSGRTFLKYQYLIFVAHMQAHFIQVTHTIS